MVRLVELSRCPDSRATRGSASSCTPGRSRAARSGAAAPARAACGSRSVRARAARLFCNQIYNYNCKLTLSSGPESRSYGISINYRFNLRPMSTVRTIDHMIDSGSMPRIRKQ